MKLRHDKRRQFDSLYEKIMIMSTLFKHHHRLLRCCSEGEELKEETRNSLNSTQKPSLNPLTAHISHPPTSSLLSLVERMRCSKSTNLISQNDKFSHLTSLSSLVALVFLNKTSSSTLSLSMRTGATRAIRRERRSPSWSKKKYQITYSVIQYWSIFIKERRETSHESGATSENFLDTRNFFPHFTEKRPICWWGGHRLESLSLVVGWKKFSRTISQLFHFETLQHWTRNEDC